MENKIKQFFLKHSVVDCKKVYIVCKGSTNLSDYDLFLQDYNEENSKECKFYFLIQKGKNYYDLNGNVVAISPEIKSNLYPATEGLINAPAVYIGQKGYTQMEMYLLGISILYRSEEQEIDYQNKNSISSNRIYCDSVLQKSNQGYNYVNIYKDFLKTDSQKTDGYMIKTSKNGQFITKQQENLVFEPKKVKKLQNYCEILDKNGEENYKYKVSELQKIEKSLNGLIKEFIETCKTSSELFLK